MDDWTPARPSSDHNYQTAVPLARAKAGCHLGEIYEGAGLALKARECYKKSINYSGSVIAYYRLARLLVNGDGIEQNLSLAEALLHAKVCNNSGNYDTAVIAVP